MLVTAVLASGVTSAVVTWLFGEASRARERRQKQKEVLGLAVFDLLSTRKKLLLACSAAEEMHTFFEVPREALVPFLPNILKTYFKIDESIHQRYEHAAELLATTNPVLAAELRGRTRLLEGMSTLAEVLKEIPVSERTVPTVTQLVLLKKTTLPMMDTAIAELARRQGHTIARDVRAHLKKPFELTAADRINLRSMITIAKAASEAEEGARAASSKGDLDTRR
jgi:hypothetical protein